MSDQADTGMSIANTRRPDWAAASITVSVCPYYLMGRCAFGDQCRRHHPDDPHQKIAVPCRYFASGRCNKGPSCVFQHVLTESIPREPTPEIAPDGLAPHSTATASIRNHGDGSSVVSDDSARKLCNFHMYGTCRYGARCWFAHGTLCNICGLNAMHPDSVRNAELHVTSCRKALLQDQLARASKGVACMICHEYTMVEGRKFGLLENCRHAFCLDCIRTWRSAESADMFGRRTVRSCPVCRMESFFVIPSVSYEFDMNLKDDLLVKYKETLGNIPCKNFNAGKGKCPFGKDCLYYHGSD